MHAVRVPSLGIAGKPYEPVVVTVGNMIGGMLIGITYWFIYLRKAPTNPSKPL